MSGLLNKMITNGSVQRLGTIPDVGTVALHLTAINTNVSNDPADTTANRTLEIWAAAEGVTPSLVDRIEYCTLEKNNGRLELFCRIHHGGEVLWVQSNPGVVVRADYVAQAV